MKILPCNLALAAIVISLAWAAPVVAAPADSTAAVEKEIAQMDAKLADRNMSREQRTALQSDKFLSVHGSGWLYTKMENATLGTGLPKPTRKVIFSEQTPHKIVVYNNDSALETWISTSYFDVPDPQEEARRLGTMTMNGPAMEKAARAMAADPTRGPNEGAAPNPYRVRNSRLWVRENGVWKIGFEQATRVGERDHPGY